MPNIDVGSLAVLREMTTAGEARTIRLAAHVSLSEVAGSVGVDQSTVWRWETGNRSPRGAAALRYLELLKLLGEVSHAS